MNEFLIPIHQTCMMVLAASIFITLNVDDHSVWNERLALVIVCSGMITIILTAVRIWS